MINPLTVDNFPALFISAPLDVVSDFMIAPTISYLFWLVLTGVLSSIASTDDLLFSDLNWCYLTIKESPAVTQYVVSVLLSPRLCSLRKHVRAIYCNISRL